jgi:hypothetical protein
MNNMNESPTIKEIRETRKKISSRFGHSIDKLVDHYLAKQKSLAPKSHKRLLKVGAKKSCATSVR